MIIKQPSTKLSQHQIMHAIGGSEVNFKQSAGEIVYENSLSQVLKALDIKPKQLYHGNQVHGANVEIVNANAGEHPLFAGYPLSPETDGFITAEAEVALLVRMADCTPIVIYDPVNKVIAAVHSGWRSTVQKISHEAIHKMVRQFGSEVAHLVAYVGPSIDQANYDVGPEVYEAFEEVGNRERYFKAQGEKYLLDMVQANIEVLKLAGMAIDNIEFTTESTYTSERLHSARKEGKEYQLNALVVMMSKSQDSLEKS